ncbi:hypothetical protein FM036_32840 [Nostoc sp. HG1]|nr:hypothetical protein [Nostoc sp. HG1]
MEHGPQPTVQTRYHEDKMMPKHDQNDAGMRDAIRSRPGAAAAIGSVALVGAGLVVGALFRGWRGRGAMEAAGDTRPSQSAVGTLSDVTDGEHVPIDLKPEVVGDRAAMTETRAPDAFRPDLDAVVAPAERDAFAPATKPLPPLSVIRGNGDDDDGGLFDGGSISGGSGSGRA